MFLRGNLILAATGTEYLRYNGAFFSTTARALQAIDGDLALYTPTGPDTC